MMNKDEIDDLKLIFVTRQECDAAMTEVEAKQNSTEKALIEIKTKMNMTLAILGAIGVAILGIAVKVLFGA